MRADPPLSGPASSNMHRWFYMLFGVLLGALFLYLTARNVNLDEAAAAIYAINGLWLIPLTLIYILTYVLRSLRWQLMFPDQSRPSLRHAVDAFMMGKIGNNFLPGRLGELIRATVIGRSQPQVGVSGSLATIVLEKILDALAVLLLLGIALMAAPLPAWLANAGLALIAILPSLLLALFIVDKAEARKPYPTEIGSGAGVLERTFALIHMTLQQFSTGLFALRSAQHFTLLGALTLFIWVWEVIIIFLCMQAFAIPAPFSAAVVTLVFLCLGTMLPSAPGFIGTYQLFIVAALTLYSVPETSAFALSVFLNAYIILQSSLLGLAAIGMEGGLFNLRQVFSSVGKRA